MTLPALRNNQKSVPSLLIQRREAGGPLPSQPSARRRRDIAILASGPVLGAGVGAVTNVITSDWNWWLFVALVVLVSFCAAGATYMPGQRDEPIPAVAPTSAVSTLPPASPVFAGRRRELERIVSHPGHQDHRAVLFLITGEPGVGKTELAVQAAHRLAGHFPDAQLFLAYRSHRGESGRLDVRDVLLDALGTFAPGTSQIALDTDRLASSWRAATTGRRILMVLDDVVTNEQVMRLLPNSRHCLVISTSRRLLAGIDPDLHLSPGELTREEAEHMIREIVRRASHELGDATIRELAAIYRLPLTVRHAVDQLVSGTGPEAIRMSDHGSENSVFTASFSRLRPRERLVLHRATLYPGPHLTEVFAAALANISPAEAEQALGELHRLGLIHKPDPYGYGFHDLVRTLAMADGREHDDEREHERALVRLLQAALDVVGDLNTLIHAPVFTSTPVGRRPSNLPPMTQTEALTWMSRYFTDLRAVIRLAIDRSWTDTWRLVNGISYYMRIHRNIPQIEEFNRSALQIAIADGNHLGQAVCHIQLGRMARTRSDYATARSHAHKALPLFVDLNDVRGQATSHAELGYIDHHLSLYEDAAAHAEQAVCLYLQVGDTQGRGDMEGLLGMLGRLTGDYRTARGHLEAALALFAEVGNERSRAWIHLELGIINRQTRAYDEARRLFQLARETADRTGDRNRQAWADRELGILARMTGDFDEAMTLLSAALHAYRDIGGRRNIGDVCVELGTLHRVRGDLDTARTQLSEAMSIYRDIGNRRGLAWTEIELGVLDSLTGAVETARERFDRAMVVYTEIRDNSGAARTHFEQGSLAASQGNDIAARSHWEAALRLYESMGSPAAEDTRSRLSAL
ncbi:tetratricopeptide repeat protein [Streptomyces ossamyceticus]|nr:tetratricopeptide repeat protein [Streptomyces ossamyceticus]